MTGNEIRFTIMQLRDKKGVSQEDVAAAIGENRGTIRNWENGTRRIKAEAIIKLAKYFGVSADYLLGLSEVESPDADLQAVCKYTGMSEAAIKKIVSMKLGGTMDAPFTADTFNAFVESSRFNYVLSSFFCVDAASNVAKSEILRAQEFMDSNSDEDNAYKIEEDLYRVYTTLKYAQLDFPEACRALAEEEFSLVSLCDELGRLLNLIHNKLDEIAENEDAHTIE